MYSRILYFYTIFSTQYFFDETTPMIGPDVRRANSEEFPFVVSLSWKIHVDINKQELNHFCGGSLITHSHVLTAAHCIRDKQIDAVVVKIGSNDLRDADAYDIKWWIKYSEWDNVQVPWGDDVDWIHDIAILRLSHDVSSNILLPILSYINQTEIYLKYLTTAGWGRIKNDRKPRYMRVGQVFAVNPQKCKPFSRITDPFLQGAVSKLHLCTQAAPFTTILCGDSGSPVFDQDNRLIGINKSFCLPKNNLTLFNSWNIHTLITPHELFINTIKSDSWPKLNIQQ